MKEIIKNIEKLSEAFGRERPPSFHDAEIISVCVTRDREIFSGNVRIDVKLWIYTLTKDFEKNGRKFGHWFNAIANFRFAKVNLEHFQDFNHQNVIQDLYIFKKTDSDCYFVRFESIFGCDLKFECQEIELLEIETFESEKERYQPDEEKLRLAKAAWKKLQRDTWKIK